jgi:hypothetical protein
VTANFGGDGAGGHEDAPEPRYARADEPSTQDATPPRGIPAFDDTETTPPRGLPILGSPQDDADVQEVDFSRYRSDR